MYIDFIKNDYSEKTTEEREEYISRDKKYLSSIIQERITNDIEQIVERWYEIDDIGVISVNEKFIYLLKEAENLYYFGYYTGAIAIIGIACEEYCKYLANKNNIKEVENQCSRINKLEHKSVISKEIKDLLHKIRKIRNDCMHYNTSFKQLNSNQLKKNSLEMIQMYKSCLELVTEKDAKSMEKIQEEYLNSPTMSFNDFKFRNRNFQKKFKDIDLQISPKKSVLTFTSNYYVLEIDINTEGFKEMTLVDMNKSIPMSIVVDLTLPQTDLIKSKKIEEGNIIFATVISKVTNLGQTEEWQLLNIEDIYREKIDYEDLNKFK
ncbi:DUF4145 domain-containing protein [Paraclostridium sordellii]|uniref:DUF4145 domain-containing protein n=1 Tax=Paraclostridium sordellii TaxID=1505 RepID=UPI00070C391F|nr:DUF4145 domain-containing protein [Paeniclostridium sordellii]